MTVPVEVDRTSLSGLELIKAVQDVRLQPPGVAVLLDVRIAEVEEGRVVFEIDARPEFGNPLGTVQGAITATCMVFRDAVR